MWQSPLFLWHLLVQALVAGSATILIAGILIDTSSGILRSALLILLISLIVSFAMNMGEIALPHVSEDVRIATRVLTKGRLSKRFWGLVVGVGLVAPIVLTALVVASIVPSRWSWWRRC